MSLLSLIFNRAQKASFEVVNANGLDYSVNVIEFDASLSESHDREADVSQNAIEDGTSISDNVNLKPRKLSMKALISDAPVSLIGSAVGLGISSATQLATTQAKGVLGQAIGTAAGIALGSIAGLITGSPRDPKKVWEELEKIWARREPFTVVTALQRYEKMVISKLSAPRSAMIGKGLEFDVTLEEVTIVSSSIIKVAAFKTSSLGAQSNVKLGKQAGKTSASNNSILFDLTSKYRKG